MQVFKNHAMMILRTHGSEGTQTELVRIKFHEVCEE